MDQFYKDLVEKIRDAAEKDIQKIMGETGGEKIYVAALVTDSDCVTLFLAVNTLEYLKDNGGLESEDRWLPDEWGYSDESGSELSKLSRLLFEHDRAISSDGYTDEEWEQNRRQFLRRQSVPLCGSKQRMCLESERRKLPALFRFPMMTGPRMWRTGRHNC